MLLLIYHINWGVIQGFPTLRKAVTTHVKKYRIFFTCVDIASQLLIRHSPLAPLGQVDEWTAKPSRFSIQGSLSELSRIVALKHWKIRIADRQSGSNFSRRGKNQYTKGKTESHLFSDFDVGISRGWEWKSTTGRFATGRFCPFTRKTSPVGKDKVNKWEFYKLKILFL